MCLSPDLSAFIAGSRCIFIYSISETFGDNNVEGNKAWRQGLDVD